MSVIQINGRDVEWVACPKHIKYQDSGHIVLSCKKCVVRLLTFNGDAMAGEAKKVDGQLWERLAETNPPDPARPTITAPPLSPDCSQGKHLACTGPAWDFTTDTETVCSCPCHQIGEAA